ncbi:TonB-dependent receptor [Sphingomicrobium lutaoense]|uniref:Vitamin B12 transporter n=1 Tax=Sphingomicrobium lutaoense TaxID=515949 RepID=A0A839Z2C9_9SPHN|nr:TonB-dependent receptor [Sphingomicrobium lutaoense]MBB3763802.1 vitamin B12 transporter [Sphingomicrobium lutaoense]
MFQDLPPPPIIEEAPPSDDHAIIITAAREAERIEDSSKPISIIDAETVERLGEDNAIGLLRLLPSASISQTGPSGTQAQLRIRGAEASHSLLFIDGIKANDPAAGNEARFELAADGLYDIIEYSRGPQSAIWGSEALGGVLALRTVPAGDEETVSLTAEAGSFDYLSGKARLDFGNEDQGLVLAMGGQRSDGIDSFGVGGEKDGFHNLNARLSGRLSLGKSAGLQLSGFAVDGRSEFDGFDPLTFRRADTEDRSDYRLGAARAAIEIAPAEWFKLVVGGSVLASENVHHRDNSEINRTSAERYSVDGRASVRASALAFDHRLTLAIDHEGEDFRADDSIYGGFTDQRRDRDRTGFTVEWFAEHDSGATFQLALRHDDFSAFADTTSISLGGLLPLGGHVSLVANYGEGIAQPSFYDLYGFFPGSFVGNPALEPETSRGHDVGLRFDDGKLRASMIWFSHNLESEIVDIFDPASFTSTTANGMGESKRRGLELEAGWRPSPAFELVGNYSYLDAKGPEAPGEQRLRENRRPQHRAAIMATGIHGRWEYGSSLALVGSRFDDDFDFFPAQRVKLEPYVLASARVAYEMNPRLRLTLRGSNLFDSDYQDVVGYHAMGRAIHIGLAFTR